MATATLALSSAARVAPASTTAPGKRSVAGTVRPSRGTALVARAEISGLSADGQWQELCKAEIPGKIPRCVSPILKDRNLARARLPRCPLCPTPTNANVSSNFARGTVSPRKFFFSDPSHDISPTLLLSGTTS